MEKIGVVKSLEGELALVEIRRVSACGENCSSCKGGCSPTQVYVKAKNHVNASVGQYVKLYSESKTVMKAAFLVYIVPLFSLFLGIMIGMTVSSYFNYEDYKELLGIGVGFVFLVMSYIFLNRRDKKLKTEIVITDIIS
ncbi:SoxR reducing system RseC family protein [Alkaliphilus transvaalensis]|uniref:SoxR reducing system RseC family protein n=1 Tax=Alkaliphilus transvaalensis TaxID=114628 RepID=UPI00047E539F|nr:SoxR reducing system RseC family protein [Alkaliphilus transvaalensis]